MNEPTSRSAVATIFLFGSTLLVGCGGNVVFVEDGQGGGIVSAATTTSSSPRECGDIAFDFDVPAQVCTGSETCEITGLLPDGRDARIQCSIGKDATCILTIDDLQSCTCPTDQIDWTNTCPNGVPTCAGWRVDYANAEYCLTQ